MASLIKRTRSSLAAAALLALVAPVVAGCSPAGPAAVTVNLSEWAVAPSSAKVPAGTVVFTVANAGTMEHEMLVVRSDAEAGGLPVKDGSIEESSIESLGEVPETAVGASGTLRLDNLTKGHYILLCNIPGHYQQGMHADFVVD